MTLSDCSDCDHEIEKHPDLGACQVSGCECLAFAQGGGGDEPGKWLEVPEWK